MKQLHNAAARGKLDAVRRLPDEGGDVKVKDNGGGVGLPFDGLPPPPRLRRTRRAGRARAW